MHPSNRRPKRLPKRRALPAVGTGLKPCSFKTRLPMQAAGARVFVFATTLVVLPVILALARGFLRSATDVRIHWCERITAAESDRNDSGAVEHALAIVAGLIERSAAE